jgi:hypothetical protein
VDDRRLLNTDHFDPVAAVDRIADEFRAGFAEIAKIDRPAVTMFGSARIPAGDPHYEAARAIARRFAERGWAVITGGGPGIMEAGNRGAKEGGGLSVGFNIQLPWEQHENPYLDIEHTFEHFYARKVCFVMPAEGFVVMPGGFGTLDEFYEALTLIQTGKVSNFPVVLYDSEHWSRMLDWVRDELLAERLVSPEDIDMLSLTDDIEEAVEIVVDCYKRRCSETPAPAL